MKNTSIIKALIVIVLVLTGIYIWYILPAMMNVDLIDIIQGGKNELKQEEPDEREQIDENSSLEINEDLKNDIDSGYLILVNKNHGLDRDYKPDDLTGIKYYATDRDPETRYMRAEAASAFHSMAEEARGQGIVFVMTTAYRSYEFQAALYSSYVQRDGQAAADQYSAKPGNSEHQTGLAVDVSCAPVDFELRVAFANTKEGGWLSENAHLFGFIMRFPEGKEEITGYQYEPWHLRYVGIPAAEYIYTHKITLEEYLELLEMER